MANIPPDTLRLAIILGVVVPGVGHIYLGLIKRGIKIVFLLILSGTLSGAIFSYATSIINANILGSNPAAYQSLLNYIAPLISLIPLIVWIWQIRDLRRYIKNQNGYSEDKIELP